MFRDSVGNTYSRCPNGAKTNPGPKPSKGGNRKIGRNLRKPSFLRWKSRNPVDKAPSRGP